MFEGKTIMLWFLYLENEGVGHPEKISCIQTSTNLESGRESWMRNIWRNRPWRSPILPWESTSLFLHQITLYYTSMFPFMIIVLLLFQIKNIKSATRTYFHFRLIYFITEIQFFILFFIHMLCMCAFARILFCSFFLSWPSFLKPTKTSRSIPLRTVMKLYLLKMGKLVNQYRPFIPPSGIRDPPQVSHFSLLPPSNTDTCEFLIIATCTISGGQPHGPERLPLSINAMPVPWQNSCRGWGLL